MINRSLLPSFKELSLFEQLLKREVHCKTVLKSETIKLRDFAADLSQVSA